MFFEYIEAIPCFQCGEPCELEPLIELPGTTVYWVDCEKCSFVGLAAGELE